MTDWRTYDGPELERQYAPSSFVADAEALIASYTSRSMVTACSVRHRRVHYGDHPDEWVVIFPATPRAPLHVFVHGGYWQMLSASDSLFMAEAFVAQDVAFAAVNYSLAPSCPLSEIVRQCRRAITALGTEHVAGTGYDPNALHLSGHSAGAQLVAMAVTDAEADCVRSATLVSGIYDLEPLVHTSVNEAISLDASAVARNSPVNFDPAPGIRLLVAVGEHESDEFRRQSQQLAQRWSDAELLTVEGRNHFDLVFDVPDQQTLLGRAVHLLMRRSTWLRPGCS